MVVPNSVILQAARMQDHSALDTGDSGTKMFKKKIENKDFPYKEKKTYR